eukprot:m.125775 g.125775  ORF g.125775 m.125775 type:complete len:183 (-) comp12985_c0_seq19:115-663(-)
MGQFIWMFIYLKRMCFALCHAVHHFVVVVVVVIAFVVKERKKEEKRQEKLRKEKEKLELKQQKKQAKELKRGKSKPVYGGAKSWVTSGIPSQTHVVGLIDESKRRAQREQQHQQQASKLTTSAPSTPTWKPSEIKKQQNRLSLAPKSKCGVAVVVDACAYMCVHVYMSACVSALRNIHESLC